MRVVLDEVGRIVLPKRLREQLGLEPGDVLGIERSGEEITLLPIRKLLHMRKKHGIWVSRAGEHLSAAVVEKTVRRIRRDRDARNLGN